MAWMIEWKNTFVIIRKFNEHDMMYSEWTLYLINDECIYWYEEAKQYKPQIDEYLKMFAYSFSSENLFVPGWIYQIRNSILPGNFLFNKDAFKDSLKELRNLDVGNLFLDNKHNSKSSIIKSRYDTFITKLTKEGKPESNQNVNSTKEKFLAHIHNGIMISQNFIKK